MRYLTKRDYSLEESEGEGSWAVSYGDMITLLLSFFVIFFTTDIQKEKIQKMNNYVSFSLEGLKDMKSDIAYAAEKSSVIFDRNDLEGLNVKVLQRDEHIIIFFGKFSFFNSGQTDLKPGAPEILYKFVEKYLPYAGKYSLSVKGFTDKVKVSTNSKRRFRDNLELSALRSIAAMRAMQKAGIPLNRMEIAGAGELNLIEELIPEITTASQSEKNEYSRIIIIVITPKKESWL